jgi:hypothetical protein
MRSAVVSRQCGFAKAVFAAAAVLTVALTVSCASGGTGPIASLSDQSAPKPFVDAWSETLAVGTPLFAVAAGTVVRVTDVFKTTASCPLAERSADVQKSVLIEHTLEDGRKLQSWYAHLDRVDVSAGANVSAGQRIGLSQIGGCNGSPQLQIEASEEPALRG